MSNLLEYSTAKSILGRLVVFATTFIYEWGELARSHTKPKQGPNSLAIGHSHIRNMSGYLIKIGRYKFKFGILKYKIRIFFFKKNNPLSIYMEQLPECITA